MISRLLSILRGGGGGGTAGGCVANSPIMTGLYSCAENNGCAALGDSSHADGDGTVAGGFASSAHNWNTQAPGAASSAHGFDSWAAADLSMAIGNQSATLEQSDFAHSSGQFAERGDNQYRFHELKGETPGNGPSELVELKIGNNPNDLRPGRVYAVKCTALALLMGGGTANPEFAHFSLRFVLAVNSSGDALISEVKQEDPIILGETLDGCSLLPQVSGPYWTLTYANRELTTANVRVVARVEFVELLGS
jgi:hypothetical protein